MAKVTVPGADFPAVNPFAFGDQGALFEKTAPWTPAKTFVYIYSQVITLSGFEMLFVTEEIPMAVQ
jgi:hypothetical protein